VLSVKIRLTEWEAWRIKMQANGWQLQVIRWNTSWWWGYVICVGV
jgi:hypothetical protein